MELKLLDGTFNAAEASDLLQHIVAVKTNFHLHKIDLDNYSEEDMKHSERRIKELEDALRNAIAYMRAAPSGKFSLQSKIVLESTGEMFDENSVPAREHGLTKTLKNN